MHNGAFTYYRIQHKDSKGRWCNSDLGEFIFSGMTYGERTSRHADEIRNVISREHDLWQIMGENGFLKLGDVLRAYEIIKKYNQNRKFRIVRIHQMKTVEKVIG